MISAAKSTEGSSMIRGKADKRKDRGTDAGRQVEVGSDGNSGMSIPIVLFSQRNCKKSHYLRMRIAKNKK